MKNKRKERVKFVVPYENKEEVLHSFNNGWRPFEKNTITNGVVTIAVHKFFYNMFKTLNNQYN